MLCVRRQSDTSKIPLSRRTTLIEERPEQHHVRDSDPVVAVHVEPPVVLNVRSAGDRRVASVLRVEVWPVPDYVRDVDCPAVVVVREPEVIVVRNGALLQRVSPRENLDRVEPAVIVVVGVYRVVSVLDRCSPESGCRCSRNPRPSSRRRRYRSRRRPPAS